MNPVPILPTKTSCPLSSPNSSDPIMPARRPAPGWTDHLSLVFAEMGLVYGNDWFVIPYALAVNTPCEVLGLVVTDVFGDRTAIRAADEGGSAWQRWSCSN